jgi:hypothetical protein
VSQVISQKLVLISHLDENPRENYSLQYSLLNFEMIKVYRISFKKNRKPRAQGVDWCSLEKRSCRFEAGSTDDGGPCILPYLRRPYLTGVYGEGTTLTDELPCSTACNVAGCERAARWKARSPFESPLHTDLSAGLPLKPHLHTDSSAGSPFGSLHVE